MRFFKKHNLYLTLLTLLLCFIGVTTIYSLNIGTQKQDLIIKQVIYLLIGLVIYLIISKINPIYFNINILIIIFYVLTILLLVLTLIVGKNINGARRWIQLGQFSLQASEFAKVIIILVTSHLLYLLQSNYFKKFKGQYILQRKTNHKGNFIVDNFSFIIMIIPSLIIIILVVLQKSLSQSIVLLFVTFFLYIFSYICDYSKFFIYISLIIAPIILDIQGVINQTQSLIFVCIIIALALALTYLKYIKIIPVILLSITSILILIFGSLFVSNVVIKAYQQDRIDAYLNESDPRYYYGLNMQQRQAKIAFGSGEIFGKGFGIGNESRLNNVQYAESDFIFSAFGEQFGFMGVLILFVLYFLIIFEIIRCSQHAQNERDRLICYGVAILLLSQIVIHIFVNLRILPNTGTSLPFISYGGSSLWTFLIAVGLVQAVTNVPKKFSYLGEENLYETFQ